MKKISYLTLLGCLIMAFFLSGCSEKLTKSNLIIANKSSEIISNISIQRINKTDVMGSFLKPNEHSYFDMGMQQNCAFKVVFEDKNNQSTSSNEFTSNFTKDGIVNINVLKDTSGEWSVILRN